LGADLVRPRSWESETRGEFMQSTFRCKVKIRDVLTPVEVLDMIRLGMPAICIYLY
jgi:hypothetical protein